MTKPPVSIDLFAGAGGLALGVEAAGFATQGVVENNETAVETLNVNRAQWFGKLPEVVPTDITKVDPIEWANEHGLLTGGIDLLVGGPPCVAFSKSGFHLEYKRLGLDPNADLLSQYLSFVDALQPRAYLMENVPGLAYRNQSEAFFDALRAGLIGLGYSFQHAVLNAADFGIPQNRQRLFVVGFQDGSPFSFPMETHWGEHERRKRPAHVHMLKPHVTAGNVLGNIDAPYEAEEVVSGKYGHLLPEIPAGRNYLHYTEHEGHPKPLFRWRSRYWTFLLKLDPDRPASTIQAQPGPYVGPFHWENRRLRVPEIVRLHTFPDRYKFQGSRREIQVQIGNAVPPKMAEVLALAIRKHLDGEPEDTQLLRALRESVGAR
ncbi:MAG: DNA cytosine methyltransferase [Gemmatimonadetes bacterium]|nr:DNA cytosine methyltransferase [Gemmatimonadota bacterium]